MSKTKRPTSDNTKNEAQPNRESLGASQGIIAKFGSTIQNVSQVINIGFNEKVLKRLGIEQRVGNLFLALLILSTATISTIVLIKKLQNPKPTRMSGDFRIAVAGFSIQGDINNSDFGLDIAQNLYLRLEQDFAELKPNFVVTIWGPEQVRAVNGNDSTERAKAAAELAETVGADILVYGTVVSEDSGWTITPEFYVSLENFYDAYEITGSHEFGKAYAIRGDGNIAERIGLNSELATRAQALSHIVVGLAFYAIQDFEQAFVNFQFAEGLPEWKDEEGKQVLYILMGNATIKQNDFGLAEHYYQEALRIDTEYARAYLGIANVSYRRALEPAGETEQISDIDIEMLYAALKILIKAEQSTNQPLSTDISTKIHFERGQINFMLVYSGEEQYFDQAIAEFDNVLADYNDGANPRLRYLAAEAHARLALINELSGNTSVAIDEYRRAASLLPAEPEQKAYYESRAQELESLTIEQ